MLRRARIHPSLSNITVLMGNERNLSLLLLLNVSYSLSHICCLYLFLLSLGYPSDVSVTATYTLTSSTTMRFDMEAVPNKPTPISLAQHTHWNLAGHKSETFLTIQFRLGQTMLLLWIRTQSQLVKSCQLRVPL